RLESRLRVTPELMEHGEVSQCKRDTERVRDFAGKRQRLLGPFQCVIQIAEMPLAMRHIGMAEDSHVDAVDRGVIATAGVASFQTLTKPVMGCPKGPEMGCGGSGVHCRRRRRRSSSGLRQSDASQ